jgi:hypothetical protein
MKARYSFKVKGRYSNGNTATISGIVIDEDGYPSSAFDAAIKACTDLTPGLVVDLTKRGSVVLSKQKTLIK